MALIRRDIFRNWWDDIDRYHRQVDQHFKRWDLHRDSWKLPPFPSFSDWFSPWRDNVYDYLDHQVGGTITVQRDEDKYQIIVDVQQFAPEDITVRVDHRCITIEGKREEKKARYGYTSKQFIRRYILPHGYDIDRVKPSLSSDGILTITAPRLTWLAPSERILPIQRSYRPAIKAT